MTEIIYLLQCKRYSIPEWDIELLKLKKITSTMEIYHLATRSDLIFALSVFL